MAQYGLEPPRIPLPPCVIENEEIFEEFLAWFVGDMTHLHLPLTEVEASEVLWWQEAEENAG